MSFYTALTGLKGAQTDISTTSNNIANVGSNGFKKSRADFGDIFGSTPMQTKQVGVGTQTKSITQQFGQGNLTTSSNTLDMAVSGQGFFAVQSGGAAPQTVFTRNGAFNVDDTGFIVDSNGQFLLGYPVDDDGAVANKTLAGANKLQLKAEFGAPTATTSMAMGVNLNSKEAVLPATNVFDKDDPTTYSATSSVTIFDAAGVPQSATVFYIKTQDQTDADPTFKYDTKLFVDGLEIIPKLQIAVNSKEEPLYIDKFGQQTAKPAIPDAAYIDEGKGYGLYRADDLGVAIDSTPAMLQGLALPQLLNDGKTITITTDPLEYQSTREYQRSINVANPVGTNFWGKDFMLLDIDASGPRSIDIPPGTYTGSQLAAAVEVATKHAFGDDKKIQLRAGIDNAFSIDLKVTSGDGLAAGLAIPIPVDLHAASIVNTAAEAVAGMSRDNFLSHAQVRVNDSMNAYIHEVGGAGAAGVNVANITAVNADGRLFKKLVSGAIPNTAVPKAGAPAARLSGNDIVRVTQKEGDGGAITTLTRFVAYANDSAGAEFAKPSVAAYDNLEVMSVTNSTYAKHAVGTTYANKAYFEVPTTNFTTAPEVIRFMQFPDGNAAHVNSRVETFFGSKDITVLDTTTVGATAGHYRVTIDFDMTGLTWPITNATSGAERAVQVLAKPSDHIVAYFEDTEGSVEGVKEAHYSNKVVVQEIGASAKRLAAHDTTDNTQTALAYAAFAGGNLASGQALSTLGFNTNTLSTNWVDDRKPAIKVGYDESAQRLTFDSDNAQLGLGTGTGMNSFTVYSKVLTSDTNGVGIPVFGNNKDISLAGDDMVLGESFIATGPDVQPANKRYGMDVYFDTVKNVFEIKSGKTGEAIAANGAVGVTANQTKSDIKLGRYKLTPLGAKDPTDDGIQITNKVGGGTNQIMGFPRDGTDGFFAATGLMSKPAIATGAEALINMEKAFTLTSIADENKFNLVVDGVSAFIELPPANYTGTTLATALEARINVMQHPISGISIGGVDVTYDNVNNNLIFTTGTQGDNSTLKIEGAVRFGLDKVPLGIGKTTDIKTPQQATDANNRPLFVSPSGVITSDTTDFIDNLVEDFYPLYLDDGELTFSKTGALESPITKVTYEGLPNTDMTVDFSGATQFATPFKATAVTQDGKGAGRLTGLEIDNYGNVLAGYSNGENVSLGKIILANFSNNSGLKQIGNSTFAATASSGAAELGEAALDGFGNIMSGSLERSNVDITEELVNLITAQRNYQAAAKAMETTTSMTQTIINIRN